MKCGKCGTENLDTEMFCTKCGAELYTGENVEQEERSVNGGGFNFGIGRKKSSSKSGILLRPKTTEDKEEDRPFDLPDTENKKEDIKTEAPAEPVAERPKKSPKAPRKEKGKTAAKKQNILLKLKIAAGAAAAIAVVVLVIIIAGKIDDSKGGRIASSVPLGRNIEFCIKDTGEEFTSTTKFKDLKSVASFDYVCESDKEVNISGISVPKWAVLVSEDNKRVLDTVEYYNFTVLKNGWKGEHSNIRLTSDSVTYGMDEKTVTKTVGFKPYYTKKTSDNKALNCYRYYIIDNDTGSERVFNYYVEFNDVNGTVINAYDTEINYVNYVLGIK